MGATASRAASLGLLYSGHSRIEQPWSIYSVEATLHGGSIEPYRSVQAWQLECRGHRQVLGGEGGGDGGGVGGRLQLLVLLGPVQRIWWSGQ